MPVRIRSARLSDREEVPLHWESCRLKAGWRVAGWAGGLAAAGGGVAGMVLGQGGVLEPLGAAVAASAAVVVALVARCGRWSTSVGREWVRTGAGPFVRMVPLRAVGGVRVRPATGVRRLFSASEVVLELDASGEGVPIASPDPGELRRALPVPGPGGTEAPGGDGTGRDENST